MTRRQRWILGQLVVVVALGPAVGVLAGWLWERAWTPATGVALRHQFALDGQGAPQAFGATGSYVFWAIAAGILAGVLAGLVARSHELATLGLLLGGAALGGWLMAVVGHSLGPPDPAVLAKTLADFEPLRADLRVAGLAPYLALPAGALLGLATAFVAEAAIRRVRHPAAPPAATLGWQQHT
jgi:hypothetical protein